MLSKRFLATHILSILIGIVVISTTIVFGVSPLKTKFNNFIGKFSPKADVQVSDCSQTMPSAYSTKSYDIGGGRIFSEFSTSGNKLEIGDQVTATFTHGIEPVWTQWWRSMSSWTLYKAGIEKISMSAGIYGTAISKDKGLYEGKEIQWAGNKYDDPDGNLTQGTYTSTFKITKPSGSWKFLTYNSPGKEPWFYPYNWQNTKYVFYTNGGVPLCTYCKNAVVTTLTPVDDNGIKIDASSISYKKNQGQYQIKQKFLIETTYKDSPISSEVNLGYYKQINDKVKGNYMSLQKSYVLTTGEDGKTTHEFLLSGYDKNSLYYGPYKLSATSSWKCIEPAKTADYTMEIKKLLSPTIKPISYLRYDNSTKKDIEKSLIDTNPDVEAKLLSDTNFIPGDKITFKAGFDNIEIDQDDITVELPLPLNKDNNPQLKFVKLIADENNSRFSYDEVNKKLIWKYTNAEEVDNQLKKDQIVEEKFQLKIADLKDLNLGDNSELKMQSQIPDSLEQDKTKWIKSNEVKLKIIDTSVRITSCDKDYKVCDNFLNGELFIDSSQEIFPENDPDNPITDANNLLQSEAYIKYSLPELNYDRENITADIYLPDDVEFVSSPNPDVKPLTNDKHLISWNINKIEKNLGYSVFLVVKLDKSIPKEKKYLLINGDYKNVNAVVSQSNDLRLNIWGKLIGQITTPFGNPLSYANMIILDGESDTKEDLDKNLIVKGVLYQHLQNPENPKLEEKDYTRTDNKGKYAINFNRNKIKNDNNTIKLRLDFWDSRAEGTRMPILKEFYSNHNLAHLLTTSFDISSENITKKDMAISDNGSVNKQNFDYPDSDAKIQKEFPALAEVYYNLYLAYLKINAEFGDFNITLDPKIVVVNYDFDEKIGDNGKEIDYGPYLIKDNKLILSMQALDITKDRRPFYEYHQLAHAIIENIYKGTLEIPEVPLWILPFKTPNYRIFKPMGGYMNDYTTDSLLEGLANIISLELSNKVFGRDDTEYIDNYGNKFNINDPIAIFNTENNNNESRAITNLFYGLLHGVSAVGNESISHLNIDNGNNIYKISFPNDTYNLKKLITLLKNRKPKTLYDVRCDLMKYEKVGQDGANEIGLNYLDRLFIRHGVFADLDGDYKFSPNSNEKRKIGWSSNKETFKTSNGIEIGSRNWRK